MTSLGLDEIFEGRRVPPWLRRFESEPERALGDLLIGAAALGHLSADEPEEVLSRWLVSLGPDFVRGVDSALADWIDRNWGDPLLGSAGVSVTLVAQTWCRAGNLIASEPGLGQAARRLRELLLEDRQFLSSLAESRVRDPEARAWLALARHQQDRSLLQEWWRLCTLPPEVPWYHGQYGVAGLRGIPRESPDQEGIFPDEVAEGLARFASALGRRAEDGWLDPGVAYKEFQQIARLTMAAYPWPEVWAEFWRGALAVNRLRSDNAEGWVRGLFPKELEEGPSARRGAAARVKVPDPNWRHEARRIKERLTARDWTFLEPAKRLLQAEAAFAEATGDAYDFVRSACTFAARIRKEQPSLALEWAQKAREFEPWNAFTWNTTTEVLLVLDRPEEALTNALKAVQRFPEDVVARTGLGEVLKAQGRFEEAEARYRETVSRFPLDVVARNGLGEVLKAQGRFEEAEAQYRETVSRFPSDVYARTGLGEVLKAQGHLEEAEAQYRETVSRFPESVFARNGLGDLLKVQGHLEEAEVQYRATVSRFPESVVARNGLGDVLKAQGRFEEAEAVYREAVSLFPQNVVARGGLKDVLRRQGHSGQAEATELELQEQRLSNDDIEIILQDVYLLRTWSGFVRDRSTSPGAIRQRARDLLRQLIQGEAHHAAAAGELGLWKIEEGDLDNALGLLRDAVRRFPGSTRVRYALARAEREAAARRGVVDDKDPDVSARPWRQLIRLDERLKPLIFLGEGRTWLVQTDGQDVLDKSKDCLGQLGHWTNLKLQKASDRERDEPSFVTWWAREVRSHVFGEIEVRRAEDISDLSPIQERVLASGALLNRLEEHWVNHWARA